jgi:hypothetical protein
MMMLPVATMTTGVAVLTPVTRITLASGGSAATIARAGRG